MDNERGGMITHYIAYYEGLDANGHVIVNGNIAADAENLTEAGAFMNYLTDKILTDAQVNHPALTRIVLKGVFKL
ncbi:TPA: hypothetical protein OMT60_004437 [Enterobacter hormaechei]|uniref:hypothetical protein n=1 Tax=Enterobacter cloacae complex sp. 2022EL-00747 TaxID=2998100 RepID=UPI00226EEB86|nr:hypothetical protein [Enterobacter cloacae complex sp. 2022EL-00747]MCY0808368.1 hypothetical protein [Enterobacter cloacae complex sp. 2022EL-00747]HCR0894965.1 hypothetical protein [Enterobacter hormaechei]